MIGRWDVEDVETMGGLAGRDADAGGAKIL